MISAYDLCIAAIQLEPYGANPRPAVAHPEIVLILRAGKQDRKKRRFAEHDPLHARMVQNGLD